MTARRLCCSLTIVASLVAITFSFAHADDAPDLAPLVALLGEIDDPGFQLDILKGMREGLKGRKRLPTPAGWTDVYPQLAKSSDAEVRRLATELALVFGDQSAINSLRATMTDETASKEKRLAALATLVEYRIPGLAADLQKLLDDAAVRQAAIRGLAAYDDDQTPEVLLRLHGSLPESEKQDVVATLSSRPAYALALLDGVENERVDRGDISAFAARQLLNLDDDQVTERLREVWGEVRQTSAEKKKLMEKYKKLLTEKYLKDADLSHGRLVFSRTCVKCHKLYGVGGEIGPDLTGSNRNNLHYVLENVLDPSAVIGKDYRLTVMRTIDGRTISGIVVEQSPRSLTLQTEKDRILVSRDDILQMKISPVSMMPDGQIEKMNDEEVRDLVAYLGSKTQVDLPAGVVLEELLSTPDASE